MPIKFSQFTNRTSDTATTYIVGFDGNQNIKILSSDLLSGFINGSGTVNKLPIWTGSNVLGDSLITQTKIDGGTIFDLNAVTTTNYTPAINTKISAELRPLVMVHLPLTF